MTIPATIVLGTAILALCLLSIQRFLKNRNTALLVVNLAIIIIAGGVLVFSFDLLSFELVGRGRNTDDILLEIALIVLMFLAMLLGMGAAYLYARLTFSELERHFGVNQSFIQLSGSPAVVAVAAPTDSDPLSIPEPHEVRLGGFRTLSSIPRRLVRLRSPVLDLPTVARHFTRPR